MTVMTVPLAARRDPARASVATGEQPGELSATPVFLAPDRKTSCLRDVPVIS